MAHGRIGILKPFGTVLAAFLLALSLVGAPTVLASGGSWTVTTLATPKVASGDEALYTVLGLGQSGSSDAWAVGVVYVLPSSDGAHPSNKQFGEAKEQPFAEYWNGSKWVLTDPLVFGNHYSELTGVDVISQNDVWAVGVERPSETYVTGERFSPLILHWNGNSWSASHIPDPSAMPLPSDVAGTSANNVWVCGSTPQGVYHWNGSSWTQVPEPFTAGTFVPQTMATTSSGAVYVANSPFNGNSIRLEEYANGAWSGTTAPEFGGQEPAAVSVAVESSGAVYVTGQYLEDVVYQGQPEGESAPFTFVDTDGKWTSLNPPSPYDPTQPVFVLYGGLVLSQDNIWLVGAHSSLSNEADRNLAILNYNGHSWTSLKKISGDSALFTGQILAAAEGNNGNGVDLAVTSPKPGKTDVLMYSGEYLGSTTIAVSQGPSASQGLLWIVIAIVILLVLAAIILGARRKKKPSGTPPPDPAPKEAAPKTPDAPSGS